jgi:hypothetical protein
MGKGRIGTGSGGRILSGKERKYEKKGRAGNANVRMRIRATREGWQGGDR